MLWASPRAKATRALSSATVSTVCARATAQMCIRDRACEVHGVDCDELLEKLNAHLASKKA